MPSVRGSSILLECLLAQSRHPDRVGECPLSGVKRTSTERCKMSASDPKPKCNRIDAETHSELNSLFSRLGIQYSDVSIIRFRTSPTALFGMMHLHPLHHHASAGLSLGCLSGRTPDRRNHVPLRSRRVWKVTYSSGITKMPMALAAIIPAKTGVPTSCRLIWAAPWATTSGKTPRMKAHE